VCALYGGMIYLLCESDETYGLNPVCCYDNKQDAERVLHFIDAISYELNKLQDKLNEERMPITSVWDTWSEGRKTEWHNRWGANNMWAENAVRTVHYQLREYYTYVVIEIEIGKTIGSIQ
jgi:hypothetical protein